MEHLNIKSFWSRKYNLIFFLTCTLADVHIIGNIQIICMSHADRFAKISTSTASRITTIAAISLLCFLILFMFFLPLIHTYDQAKDKTHSQ